MKGILPYLLAILLLAAMMMGLTMIAQAGSGNEASRSGASFVFAFRIRGAEDKACALRQTRFICA